ncbi:MAG TPA: SpoIIE family protein phosphatase [Nannocystaceae bacterium]|nr:SpoIIE family protein phosphatase [Nannocystaceae bacterium]
MTVTTPEEAPWLEWAAAARALHMWEESGDLHVVQPFAGGALVAVIDGLGHGDEAALAARVAAERLREHATRPVLECIEICHEALRKTRGAVMSVASIDRDASIVRWAGIGNVEAVLVRASSSVTRPRESLNTRGGVVGYQLPPMRVDELAIEPGDVLVLVTDGIRGTFMDAVRVEDDLQRMADHILGHEGKGTDDELVLVVRYLGGRS